MARRHYPLRPTDQFGKQLRPGDRVRVVRRPQVRNDPPETRVIFRRAVGRIFLLEDFNQYGFAELDLHKLEPWNSVSIEPHLLRRISRGRIVPSLRWLRRQIAT